MSVDELTLAADRRREESLDQEIDQTLSTLLAHYEEVTANPRSMGYLRSLLKHYAKELHPWRACFPADTLIDGRMISDLAAGDLVWTLNLDRFDFEQQPVVWAGVTRHDAVLMEVALDEGDPIRTTPDHLFLKRDGSWVEAGDLRPGDWLLSMSVGSSRGARGSACPAIAFAGARSIVDESCVLSPEMSMDTTTRVSLLDERTLKGVVRCDDFSDPCSSSNGHERVDRTHNTSGSGSVNTPFRGNSVFVGFVSDVPDFEENGLQPVKRISFVLAGDKDSIGTSEGVGFVASVGGSSVPAEAPLSFEESGGPREVDGRQVVKVGLLDKREDVWDIEVSKNHNFLVSGVVVHNCYKDNLRRFGPKTAAVCGVLKDALRQSTKWRGHPELDHGAPGVAIAEADKSAAPPFGGHHGLKLDVPDEIWALLADLAENCDPCRVMLGLDPAPQPSETFLSEYKGVADGR